MKFNTTIILGEQYSSGHKMFAKITASAVHFYLPRYLVPRHYPYSGFVCSAITMVLSYLQELSTLFDYRLSYTDTNITQIIDWGI